MIQSINDFLSCKRDALVGFSRNPKHFNRVLTKELVNRGFEVLPVNPRPDEITGIKCWANVASITPPPEAVIIGVSAANLSSAVDDCIAAGVNKVWILRSPRDRAARQRAADLLRQSNILVIDGSCPFMYLQEISQPHALHGWIWKVFGMWGR
jgi:predicted CoA-binding protein